MRSAILFMIAILTPCAVLGWVSWRSMREEAGRIRTQKTALYQQSADNAARDAAKFMAGQLQSFGESVDRLLTSQSPAELQRRFHQALRNTWPLAEAGLVLDSETGRILPQAEPSEPQVTAFVSRMEWFFNSQPQAVFVNIPDGEVPSLAHRSRPASGAVPSEPQPAGITAALNDLAPATLPDAPAPAPAKPATAAPAEPPARKVAAEQPPAPPKDAAGESSPAPGGPSAGEDAVRLVRPESPAASASGLPSSVKPVTTTIARLISKYETGMLSVPHETGLFTLLWFRPPDLPGMTFAAALDSAALTKALAAHRSFFAPDDDTCLALINHTLKPAARWTGDGVFEPESWSAPLVSREIGTALPRWEASVFLRDPAVFNNAATAARWQLGLIVTIASLAAITGATIILRDARRAARDARLKTDFVSNVSHELKTPLTSIRMFSDLLGSNPEVPPEKTKRYAEVIAGEAARLTRLINNVLNFSRMESGRENLQSSALDLRSLTTGTIDHMRPQLEKDGFSLEIELPENPVTISGDSDALSQVLLNLLSNAAKYGIAADRPRTITVRLTEGRGRILLAVADRGPGVPRGHERRIFEKFQRAHDSLASGTAGSGLGLTIARRLVEVHGGTLEYSPREGGGAVFTVCLNIG